MTRLVNLDEYLRHVRTGFGLALCLALLGGCAMIGGPSGPRPDPAALLDPSSPGMNVTAPDSFNVIFQTTEGDIVLAIDRSLAPIGVDRFYNLVRNGFYRDIAFFRNIEGFVAQFGIHGDPAMNRIWRNARIPDDSVRASNVPGTISFATAGPNSRTVQLFINHGDNSRLDAMGFAPFGRVIEGQDVLSRLYTGYGEGAPRGRGPDQDRIQSEGNTYLRAQFPEMDYLIEARIAN